MILYQGLTVTVGGWLAGFEMNFSKWYIGLPKNPPYTPHSQLPECLYKWAHLL